MIAVAVPVMCFLMFLSSYFHRKGIDLGRWRIPFAIALGTSIIWVFYIALRPGFIR